MEPHDPAAPRSLAHAAIHARRHAWNWRLLWRITLRAAVLAAMGTPIWTGDYQPTAWKWWVIGLGAASFLILPVARVIAGRRPVRLPLRVRGAQTPLAWIATLWWILPIWESGIYGHSNQGATRGIEQPVWLSLAVIAVVPIILLLVRARTSITADERGIHWRGNDEDLHRGEYPDAELLPLSGSDLSRFTMVAIWYALLALCVMEGRWYLSTGFLLIALVIGVLLLRTPRAQLDAEWHQVSLVALEAGNRPAVVIDGVGTLDVSALLAASDRGDRLLAAIRDRGAPRPRSLTLGSDHARARLRELAATTSRAARTHEAITLRPQTPLLRRNPGAILGGVIGSIALVLATFFGLRSSDAPALELTAILIAGIAVSFALALAILARARIFITPQQLHHRRLLRTHVIDTAHVSAIVAAPVVHNAHGAQGGMSLSVDALLLRRDGTLIHRIGHAEIWGEQRLRQLADALGAPLVELGEPLTQEAIAAALGPAAYRPPSSPYVVALWASAIGMLCLVAFATFSSGALDEVLRDRFDPDPPLTRQQLERRALGDRIDILLPDNFGRMDEEPVDLACMDDGIDACPLGPELRTIVERGTTANERASIICRCDPAQITHAVAHDEEPVPDGTPGGGTWVRASLPNYDVQPATFVRLRLHYAPDRATLLDVSCATGERHEYGPGLLAAPADATIEDLRCTPGDL